MPGRTFTLAVNGTDTSEWSASGGGAHNDLVTDGSDSTYLVASSGNISEYLDLTNPGINGIITAFTINVRAALISGSRSLTVAMALRTAPGTYTSLGSNSLALTGSPANYAVSVTPTVLPNAAGADLLVRLLSLTVTSGVVRVYEVSSVDVTIAEVGVDAVPVGF